MRRKLLSILALVSTLASSGFAAKTNVFVEAGIAATDREWQGTDYRRAAEVFTSGRTGLPRVSDEDGKALLERLTSTNNFSFYRNKTLPLATRMEDFFNLLDGATSILKLYTAAAIKGENVHREATLLMAFTVRMTAVGMELTDEFLPTIPKDDKYAIRMDGLKKVYLGITGMFVGAERSLTESFFTAADRSTLLEAMAAELPHLKRAFSAEYRVELRTRLQADKQGINNRGDLQRIDRMLAELEN